MNPRRHYALVLHVNGLTLTEPKAINFVRPKLPKLDSSKHSSRFGRFKGSRCSRNRRKIRAERTLCGGHISIFYNSLKFWSVFYIKCELAILQASFSFSAILSTSLKSTYYKTCLKCIPRVAGYQC